MLDNMFTEAINDIERKSQKEDFQKYAKAMRDLYEAFKDNGFTSAQSLELVKQFMLASFIQQGGNNGK